MKFRRIDRRMTENYIFRKFRCGLSKKDTAELCFKSVNTITKWDKGKSIPPECRRLMRMYKGLELSSIDKRWEGWRIANGVLCNESGLSVVPEQILTGYALIEISAEDDRAMKLKIIKFARMFNNM
ncbi:regulator [Photobacterium sp. GB-56]|nr:regulator [Photobacterium sp. GB-56]PSV27077.1 regulator [Photobacterium sp. GB-56]